MEAICMLQPVSDSRQYYYNYKGVREDFGPREPCTLVSGWPLVDRGPLAVGFKFYYKDPTADDRKELLSRALMNYTEPKPVEHDLSLWQNLWDDLTFKSNRCE